MKKSLSPLGVARAHGVFNILGGAWPIVGLSSFEFVYGKKADVFLQKTVGGLLLSIGVVQISSEDSVSSLSTIRRLGLSTAVTLLAIDLVYIPRGEMRKTYIQDAICELGWIAAWGRSKPG